MVSKLLLFPYWLVLKIRNRRYDSGAAKSTFFEDIPVISIGNVTVGGTGKTPMTEYIIRRLIGDYKVAVLSRGYKRKSDEFHIVSETDTVDMSGDEPLQIKRKFPSVTVAVCKDRVTAVQILKDQTRELRPDVIILDDGFQYRRLKPMLSIVLQDYNRPIFKDELLPLGRLRDLPEQIRRADVMVCTKCPEALNDWERSEVKRGAHLGEDRTMLFAKSFYGEPMAVFPELGNKRYIYSKDVFVFTGIASDNPILLYLSDKYDWIAHEKYPDHHKFTDKDALHLNSYAKAHPRALLLTTEKDAQRLRECSLLSEEFKSRLFYLPVMTQFLSEGDAESFDELLRSVLPRKASAPLTAEPDTQESEHKGVRQEHKQKAQSENTDWTLF